MLFKLKLKKTKTKALWWGYVHNNGEIRARIYYSESDIQSARESDFVNEVYGPIWAYDRNDAIFKINELHNAF